MSTKEKRAIELEKLKGGYKVSRDVLFRMIGNRVCDAAGNDIPSLSKCEIVTLLYMTQICSKAGKIDDIKINELGELLGYSSRNTYHVIDNLARKGFIQVTGNCWTGYRSIVILGNDYTKIKKYTAKTRYLNTNSLFFLRNSEGFSLFTDLSLYAMRTMLYIMYNYDYNNGYRLSVDNLMECLGIKSRYLCLSYLKELEKLLGNDYYTVYRPKTKRIKYGIIFIHSGLTWLVAENEIQEDQDSYFKYKLLIYLRKVGIEYKNVYQFASSVFRIVYYYLSNSHMNLGYIETISKNIILEGADQQSTLRNINLRLAELNFV